MDDDDFDDLDEVHLVDEVLVDDGNMIFILNIIVIYMEKSLLTFVENHTDHVVSVYTYTLGNKLIPVLVVHDFDDETQEKLAHISEPGWIILTQNDLDHGDDVFCVVLLHIQCNSVCER